MGEFALKEFNQKAWDALELGIVTVLMDSTISTTIDVKHIRNTPKRVVAAWKEMMSGCLEDPREVLRNGRFPVSKYTQMVHMSGIKVYSLCAHHLLPFIGEASFAYIPSEQIVGISKIPRLVQVYAKRPQVQEKLTDEIVDCFVEELTPRGCGLIIRAAHLCMECRGVKEQGAITSTTALRGIFLSDANVRAEFIAAANRPS